MIGIVLLSFFVQGSLLFCSVELLFLKVPHNPAYKSLQSTEISLYVVFMNEWNVAKKDKILMNDLFYLDI